MRLFTLIQFSKPACICLQETLNNKFFGNECFSFYFLYNNMLVFLYTNKKASVYHIGLGYTGFASKEVRNRRKNVLENSQ